jgi:hypothetical protein
MTAEPNMRDAALWYNANFIPIFPVHWAIGAGCSCGKPKCATPANHPRTRHYGNKRSGYSYGGQTLTWTIEDWWKRWPQANIGIPTGWGAKFFALESDPQSGGPEERAELVERYGPIGDTAEQITGDGGRQWFFSIPSGIVSPGSIVPARINIGPGLNLKCGSGEYVLLEPSLHISGRRYTFDCPGGRDALQHLAPAPDWLIERIKAAATVPSTPTGVEAGGVGRQQGNLHARVPAEGRGAARQGGGVMSMKCHPLAELFPLLEGQAFDEFCEDIRVRGQIEPIIVEGNTILDGRNRVRACEKLGKPVKQVQFEASGLTITPEAFIWSKNVQRRHLTGDQRTAIAMQWRPQLVAEGKRAIAEGGGDRKSENARKSGLVNSPNPIPHPPRTRTKLAKLAGVSEARIAQAEKIKDKPDLLAAVKSGKTRLRDAVRQFKGEPKPTKRKAILEGAAKRVTINILSQMSGMCRALAKINMPILCGACAAEETKTWVGIARKSAYNLRKFAAALEKEGNDGNETDN